MKQFKITGLILLMIVSIISCSTRKFTNIKSFELVAKTGLLYGDSIIKIPVSLINRTNDTLKYIDYNCSENEPFGIESATIEYLPPGCEGNVPFENKLLPHEIRNVTLICKIKKGAKELGISYKAKFWFIKPKEFWKYHIFHEDKIIPKIIYSNTVKMNI